jgi:hypothetical protein
MSDGTMLGTRTDFLAFSGRADLAAGTPPASDAFIMAGSRWLDLRVEAPVADAQFDVSFTATDYTAQLTTCRVIKEVWALTAAGVRTLLTPKSQHDLLLDFPELGSTTTGTPLFWAEYIGRYADAQVASGEDPEDRSLMIMPPVDEAYTIEVHGIFHSEILVDDTDTNYWSINYPDVLVFAALRCLEATYRNTQGVRDYEEAIAHQLKGILGDNTDGGLNDTLQMEG